MDNAVFPAGFAFVQRSVRFFKTVVNVCFQRIKPADAKSHGDGKPVAVKHQFGLADFFSDLVCNDAGSVAIRLGQ